MSVTIVVDNEAREGLASEHGLAFWIEAAGRRVLWDTGQGEALQANLEALQIDLSTADHVVLSHGHYDHGGNLAWVLEQAPRATVHWHPAATKARYSIHEGNVREIGLPDAARQALSDLPDDRRRHVSLPTELAPGLWLTGTVPRGTDFEDTGGPFFRDPQGQTADLLLDDMSLWYDTPEGLVVCLGCAHAGVVNILNHVRHNSGGRPVHSIIGGMHLCAASEVRMQQTVAYLRALAPLRIVPCHCTGAEAAAMLRQELGEVVTAGCAGQIWA